jgi:Domain of unknown function (DUF6378)
MIQEAEKGTNDHRGAVLQEAEHCVNGDRNVQYGDPNADFKRIAELWNVLLKAEYDRRTSEDPISADYAVQTLVSPEMVADMMICVKLSRNTHMRKFDNYVDMAGYAACGYHITQS